MKKNHILSYFAILFACTIWWFNWIFANVLHLPYIEQSFFRLLVPGIFTFFILFSKKKSLSFLSKEIFQRHFIIISWVNALRIFLLMTWYVMTTVANATIIQKTSVFLSVVFAYFLLHEKITIRKITAITLWFTWAIFTILWKSSSWEKTHLLWVILIFISAILSAYVNISYKKYIHHWWSMLIFQQSFLWMFIFWSMSFYLYDLPPLPIIWLALLHSFLIWVVGFYLYFFAVKYLEVSTISILWYFEIITATIFWIIFLNQVPTIFSYVWIVLIILCWYILLRKNENFIN